MEEPEKWCIKVTPENKKAIEKWRTANALLNGKGYCVNKTSFNSMIGYWRADKPSGYTEISFEEFKVYTSKPKDLTGRYVKCLVDGAQGTKCKAGEIYKLVSLDNTVETQVYKLEDGLCLCISPTTTDKWELLPEDYSANKPLKQAVHCTTQEEWDFALNKFNINNLNSIDWDVYEEKSCLSLYLDDYRDGYTSLDHFKLDEVKILSFQEWCNLNGYKMNPKFEVGKWYSFNWDWNGSNSTIIAKIKEVNEDTIDISWRSYLWRENDYSIFDRYDFRDVSNIKELSINEVQKYLPENHPDKIKTVQSFEVDKWYKKDGYYLKPKKITDTKSHYGAEYISPEGKYYANNSGIDDLRTWELLTDLSEIQQYLPNGHPDKIKSNQEFNVGDWVVVLEEDDYYSNSEKCPQKLVKILKEYELPYRLSFKDGHTNTYEKIRHATEKEMQEYFGNIEAKTYEYFNETPDRMKGKPSYHLLSIDDEELPMVNIIKTNTIKQLLNND